MSNKDLKECPVCGHRSYIKTPQTDPRRRYHKFECPECKVIITHKYAGDLIRLLDMSYKRHHQSEHETVEQLHELSIKYLESRQDYHELTSYQDELVRISFIAGRKSRNL